MRIRKRQVPLPLSSLLPVPLSDLSSNRSPTTTARYFYGQDLDGGSASLLQKNEEKSLDNSDGRDVDVKKNCRVASGSKNVHSQGESDSSTQVVEKSENGVTLRKRRVFTSFEEEEEEEEEANKVKKKKKKGKKRNAVLEEGSRCRRANGKGWRCYQQTLYGYSLCEHHLGKGRVRIMKKAVKKKKKRVKLGMVKARSISSLLGQTSSGVATESEISAPADQFPAYDKNDHGANELETIFGKTDTEDQIKNAIKKTTYRGDCGEKTRKRKREAMTREGQGDCEEKRRKKTSKEDLGWSSKRVYKKYKRLLSMVEHLEQEVKILEG